MIDAENLRWNFEFNAGYMHTHLNGLTQVDSLWQPTVPGNCINWIVGHIVCYRAYAMEVCGLPSVIEETIAQRYARDSAPVTAAAADVADLTLLVDAYQRSQTQLLARLQGISGAELNATVSAAGFTLPLGQLLTSFMRHESYHAGQLELLHEFVLHARGQQIRG